MAGLCSRAPLLGLLLLLASVSASAAKLASSVGATKERPVMKVVRLLQDMRAELQRDLDDDKQVYEELRCWCKDNEREKTAAIEKGTQRKEQLEASLSEIAAKVSELKERRAETADEIAADRKALDLATTLRMKESKAYQAESTDLMEAAKACQQAIVVLGEYHPSLSQVQSVANTLQAAKVQELAMTSLGGTSAKVLKDFVQDTTSANPSFLGVPGSQSYAPQSGKIFGILKQMKEQFEASLNEMEKAELKAKEDFDSLASAKKEEIASGEKQVVEIDADLASLGEQAVQEAKELSDTRYQLHLDRLFLKSLGEKCSMTDEEFEKRRKSRLEEIAAVEETIAFLNSDESFDLFSKATGGDTLAYSLLQASSSRSSAATAADAKQRARVVAAASVLRSAAARHGAPALALLAAHAELDAFTKVKAMIDKLVVELKKQQQDEVAHRDWCQEEKAGNERATEAGYHRKTSLEAKVSDLKAEIAAIETKMEEIKEASAELDKQMRRASEVREAENADFQETVLDQRMTQEILKKALTRMKQVYGFLQSQKPGAPHVQTSGTHVDPGNGPARFTKYEQNAGGSRVVRMLEEVYADSQRLEDEAINSEHDAQWNYENSMKDLNTSLKNYAKTLLNLREARATTKDSLSMAETDLKETMSELEGLHATLGNLRTSCDFILKNFESRQEARVAEIDALAEAKAILSGSK